MKSCLIMLGVFALGVYVLVKVDEAGVRVEVFLVALFIFASIVFKLIFGKK